MAQKKSKERPEEPLGTMSYQTSSKRSPPFWLLIGQKNTKTGQVRHCTRGSSRRSLLFFVPYFSARLDFPSPPLSVPGSPRMLIARLGLNTKIQIYFLWNFQKIVGFLDDDNISQYRTSRSSGGVGGRRWRGWGEVHKCQGWKEGENWSKLCRYIVNLALQALVITICIVIALSIFLSQSCANCRHCTLFKQ